MTQLNLSGKRTNTQSNNTQQKPAAIHESITNQTVGALGALAMFAAVVIIASCSQRSKPVAVQQPIQPMTPVSSPAVIIPTPTQAPVMAKPKAKKHRAATLSYVNPEYGVSFNFPRAYQLNSGNVTTDASAATEPLPMDFVHAGGVALAGVKLPANSYPGTDFKSGFLNVSVNPAMTSEACTQFAFPESNAPAKTDKVKIGGNEFDEVESSDVAMLKQTDAKYYQAFSNGACYEFALGIGTGGDGNVEGVTPVDRQRVFGRLEKILATVKLQPAVVPETETPVPSAGVTAPADSARNPENSVNEQNF